MGTVVKVEVKVNVLWYAHGRNQGGCVTILKVEW